MRRRRNSSGAFASSALFSYISSHIYTLFSYIIRIEKFTTILPLDVKLNKGGKGRPFGKHAFGSRRSSKNGCAHAANC